MGYASATRVRKFSHRSQAVAGSGLPPFLPKPPFLHPYSQVFLVCQVMRTIHCQVLTLQLVTVAIVVIL